MQAVYPDELVDAVCNEIAYRKGKIALNELWDVAALCMPGADDVALRQYLFNLVVSSPDAVLYEDGDRVCRKTFEQVRDDEAGYHVGVSEERLWEAVTGFRQKDSSIAGYPFELLLEIAKSKEQGINTKELAVQTKQDPRSVTGRIKKLEAYVSGRQVLYAGHVVRLLKLKKFAAAAEEAGEPRYVSMRASLGHIVDVVKRSKNGIRQTVDLKRELGFDKQPRVSKAFHAAITWLDEKGYLQKVVVASPHNPGVTIRCVRYVRDYEDQRRQDVPSDSDDDFELAEDGGGSGSRSRSRTGGEVEPADQDEDDDEIDAASARRLLQEQGLIVETEAVGAGKIGRRQRDAGASAGASAGAGAGASSTPGLLPEEEQAGYEQLYNRFYPVQSQLYALVQKSGAAGLSSMRGANKILGRDYRRAFLKDAEHFVRSAEQEAAQPLPFSIVKIYDFEGKKKFHRLFSSEYFRELTGGELPGSAGGFPPAAGEAKDLHALDRENAAPIKNSLGLSGADKNTVSWKASASVGGARRGRPKKGQKPAAESTTATTTTTTTKEAAQEAHNGGKKRPTDVGREESTLTQKRRRTGGDGETSAEPSAETSAETGTEAGAAPSSKRYKSAPLSIGGFSANSLRSLQRQRAIVDVLRGVGGVAYLRDQFIEAVSGHMRSSTLLDKKTVRGDVELLVEAGKLCARTEPATDRRMVFLPGCDEAVIADYIAREKDSKKLYSAEDVLHGTDIYFFDRAEELRFHRSKKLAKRLQAYEAKQRRRGVEEEAGGRGKQDKAAGSRRSAKEERATGKQQQQKRKQTKIKAEPATKKGAEASSAGAVVSSWNLGTKAGLRALVLAVVITKSVKNEISWDRISRLFPNNSVGNLKKQWTVRRVKMGHAGWKAYVATWRSILVEAIKEERVLLSEVEELALPKLISLWISADERRSGRPKKLYKEYAENKRRYAFVRSGPAHEPRTSLAMSSMVQRESSSLKQTYTYRRAVAEERAEAAAAEALEQEEELKTFVRSLLMEERGADRDGVEKLGQAPDEMLDKVVMELAKQKQVYLSGTKLVATATVQEALEEKGDSREFEQGAAYQAKCREILAADTGIVVGREIADYASWVYIDLLRRGQVRMDAVPVSRREALFNYSTRQLDVSSLTPPLLISATSAGRDKAGSNVAAAAVPRGSGAYARLWVGRDGHIRERVWKSLLVMALKVILYHPGIDIHTVVSKCHNIVSAAEMQDVCSWMEKRGFLSRTPFNGLKLEGSWYMLCSP